MRWSQGTLSYLLKISGNKSDEGQLYFRQCWNEYCQCWIEFRQCLGQKEYRQFTICQIAGCGGEGYLIFVSTPTLVQ